MEKYLFVPTNDCNYYIFKVTVTPKYNPINNSLIGYDMNRKATNSRFGPRGPVLFNNYSYTLDNFFDTSAEAQTYAARYMLDFQKTKIDKLSSKMKKLQTSLEKLYNHQPKMRYRDTTKNK